MKITYPTARSIRLSIDSFDAGVNTSKDQALTNMSYAINAENFAFVDGALKDGLGFDDLADRLGASSSLKTDLEAVGPIERVFYFYKFNPATQAREDKLIFISNLYRIYYVNLFGQDKTLKSLRGVTFSSIPVAVRYRLNGEDVMIFSSVSDNMVVWNGNDQPYTVLDSPRISSMALHYERLFATVDGEKSSVWFSDDLDPTNWSLSLEEAGFIELIDERGALEKVVSFCDYLYIFREYGISRLSAFGDQSSFAVSNLFVSSGKIYTQSVCVCGDKILFLAQDGLYSFDGVNTVRILPAIRENLVGQDNTNAYACYHEGRYFLACKFNFLQDDDDCQSQIWPNALVEIDAHQNKLISITHGVYIKYLTALTGAVDGVVAIASDNPKNAFLPTMISKNGSFLGKTLKKVWISPTTSFDDTYSQKTLRKLMVDTKTDIELEIISGEKKVVLPISKSRDRTIKRVNIKMQDFAFKIICSQPNCDIKHLSFEFIKSNSYF